MKPNLFKYSVLTVGIVAAMGTVTANAATQSYDATNAFSVKNKASATYTVAGNTTSQTVTSNEVVVNVSEKGAFSLIATNDDTAAGGTVGDDLNKNLTINPQAKSAVAFTHTLTNAGNVSDTYTITLANATGDDFDYNLSTSTIVYQIKENGVSVGSATDIANNGKIVLAANQSAEITVKTSADAERIINKNGILTVTATSTYLTSKSQTATASNTDNAITTTPLYAITKSATTNLGTKVFDLNNSSAYIIYTITVKNEGTLAGTAVKISDAIPTGLVAIKSTETNYVAPTVTASAGSTAKTVVIGTDAKTITVTDQDIKIGETITITFRAKKDSTVTTTATSITNYAVVTDSTADNGTFDLVDSSGDTNDSSVTEKNYEDGTLGKDNNTNATITTSNQTRSLTITAGESKEVALVTSGANLGNTYVYTITNKGTDITEATTTGSTAGAVKLSITPTAATNSTTDDPNIAITRVFVDANSNGVYDTGETVLTGTSGIYDLNAAATAGLAPNASVIIGVQVVTTGTSNIAGGVNNIGNYETLTIAVLPQGTVSGTAKPADVSTTSTTTMQGINLQKYQLADNCTTTAASIAYTDSRWVQTASTATAGQCIFYKLEATNTFTNTAISNIVVSDTLDANVTYRSDFASNATATNSTVSPLVKGTFATLAAKASAAIKFSATISQAGSTTTN